MELACQPRQAVMKLVQAAVGCVEHQFEAANVAVRIALAIVGDQLLKLGARRGPAGEPGRQVGDRAERLVHKLKLLRLYLHYRLPMLALPAKPRSTTEKATAAGTPAADCHGAGVVFATCGILQNCAYSTARAGWVRLRCRCS